MDEIIRFLLVEDDPEDAMLTVDALGKVMGPGRLFSLECVERLAQAEAFLKGDTADLILADLNLPDGRGLEALLRLRSLAPDLPILILTGLRDEALALDCLRHGAQDYLVKGQIDGKTLLRAVNYALERARVLAETRALVSQAPDGIVVIDELGLTRLINPAAESLLGVGPKELLNRPFPHEAVPGRAQEIPLSSGAAGERVLEMRTRAFAWRGRPARLAALRDVTSLRKTEQLRAEVRQRRRADGLKDRFLHHVSHELRNPLAVIQTIVYSLREKAAGPLTKDQDRLLGIAARSVDRMTGSLRELLEAGRLQAGRVAPKLKPVDAAAVLRRAAEERRFSTPRPLVPIELSLPKDLPWVLADEELLHTVVSNLLDNALRFALGRVVLRAVAVGARQPAGHCAEPGTSGGPSPGGAERGVRISVEDDGPGVPLERRGLLFLPYVPLGPGGGSGRGAGLGLVICKEIVALLKGKIWFECSPTTGSIFSVLLPRI